MAGETSKPPMMCVQRKLRICAAHRMNNSTLTEADNIKLYGKCNNVHYHGHNYTIKVTLYGPVDPVTGFVMNCTDLKEIMKVAIEEPFDHKNINKQIEHFESVVSTVENIVLFIWTEMKKNMAQPELFFEVRVRQTDNNMVYYRGE